MTTKPNRKWTYDPHFGQIRNEDGDSIASIPKGEDETGILIAAASELLEALNRAMPWLGKALEQKINEPCVMPGDLPAAIEQAKAAIAKATGETA